jgi:transcription elongation factor GreA
MSKQQDERRKIYVTPEGVVELRQELDTLVRVKRRALAERLHRAIQQGDLSENADYITAKEEQGFLEGRILQIGAVLRRAIVVETPENADCVALGTRVTVVETGTDDLETYHIVGFPETDPLQGKVSSDSPLGQALLGHAVGDIVVVRAPAGDISFEIRAIDCTTPI